MNDLTTNGKKPDLIPEDEGLVELNGFPIHWQKFGNGPMIVLLIPGALGMFFYLIFFSKIRPSLTPSSLPPPKKTNNRNGKIRFL